MRACPSNDMAMRLLEKEALADNLNFLPIAAFTKNGAVDMVNGYFNYEALKPTENAFVPEGSQDAINAAMYAYMERLQGEGIVLPYYGKCMLKYDSRTGFYVLDGVIGNFIPSNFPLYKSVLLPLQTAKDRETALQNMLVMRAHYPENFLEIRQGMRHAFVFRRFPFLKDLFPGLGLEFPKMYSLFWGKSAKIHAEILEKRKALAPATASTPLPKIKIPAAAPPAAAPVAEPEAVTPTYGNQKSGPTTPVFGGLRRSTPRKKAQNKRKTRSASGKDLATVFTRLWKAHAKKKVR